MDTSTLLVVARVVLAGVFLTAALAKALDLSETRQALLDFGAPPRLARLASALPLLELATAGGLLLRDTARGAAFVAAALLVVFTAAIVRALAGGRRPACRCFGALYSAPVGWSLVARNSVLFALALVIAVGATRLPLAWPGASALAYVIAPPVALLVLAGPGRALLRRLPPEHPARRWARRARTRVGARFRPRPAPTGLPPGATAPAFEAHDLNGHLESLEDLRAAGTPVILTFVDPGCGTCTDLLPEVARWQREHTGRLRIVVLSTGPPEDNRALQERYDLEPVLVQRDREVADAYRVHWIPSAAMVDLDGAVAGFLAAGELEIARLVKRTATARATRLGDVPLAVPQR